MLLIQYQEGKYFYREIPFQKKQIKIQKGLVCTKYETQQKNVPFDFRNNYSRIDPRMFVIR